MKKIGIITHYYDSNNYGGMLQAYALIKALFDNGYEAEQICYSIKNNNKKRSKSISIRSLIKALSIWIIKDKLNVRREAFKKFEQTIPHSQQIYSESNISCVVDLYDSFITGSDQVWNFKWFAPAYFLSFVPNTKIKIAYAVSVGASNLDEENALKLKEFIKDYTAISLREADTALFVQQLTPLKVQNTLDPTLLLDRSDWEQISNCKIIEGEYLFCYFLGSDRKIRTLAREFAREKKLKIVTLPDLQQHMEFNDLGFGQIKLYNVDPGGFVSLIRNASYIFTDSFHATAISLIFEKLFVSFGRSGNETMNNRIEGLLNFLGCNERFFPNPEKASTVSLINVSDREIIIDKDLLESKRKESIDFLKSSLK